MKILNKLDGEGEIAIALGFFDGLHLAHQKLINDCVNFSHQNGCSAAVLTFIEHPCTSLWGVKPQYILTKEARINKIKELGVDYLYLLNFDKSFAKIQPVDFLQMLTNSVSVKAIFTGFNFRFGNEKSGDVSTLLAFQKDFGYKYFEIPEIKQNGETVSSTNIRKLLSNGQIQSANTLLGESFSFTSKVVPGKQLGRTIGFPTANLIYPDTLIQLKYGVYKVKLTLNNKTYDGIMNYGLKPTVEANEIVSTEVYIKDFDSDIYGAELTVFPINYLREQKKFESLEELKTQILSDLNAAFN